MIVITRDVDETFEVDGATKRVLLDAIVQCESGRTVPLEKVLSDLRRPHAISAEGLPKELELTLGNQVYLEKTGLNALVVSTIIEL